MSLFQPGKFTAASGAVLPWKVECDALTDADWEWAASEIAHRVDFLEVEGVPSGGLRLAEILASSRSSVDWAPTHWPYPTATSLLIVDDVLTTGGSMERQRDGRVALGFVLFARGPLPPWVRALWTFTGDA